MNYYEKKYNNKWFFRWAGTKFKSNEFKIDKFIELSKWDLYN